MDHRAESERLLAFLANDTHNDSEWAQVLATRALAHATLAGLVQPIKPALYGVVDWEPPPQYCSTDRDMEPIIVFQGDAVPQPFPSIPQALPSIHWRTADGREHTA